MIKTTGERIKKLRKTLELTQREFGERIGIKPNTVATYELKRSEPIDAVISLICREFNVNETWLRTGEGEMFHQSETFSLDEYAKSRGASQFELDLAKVYFSLPIEIRTQMMDALKKYSNESAVVPATSSLITLDSREEKQAAINAQAEAYRQSLMREAGLIDRPLGTPEGIAEAEALYEKSLGIVRNSEHPALDTLNGTLNYQNGEATR